MSSRGTTVLHPLAACALIVAALAGPVLAALHARQAERDRAAQFSRIVDRTIRALEAPHRITRIFENGSEFTSIFDGRRISTTLSRHGSPTMRWVITPAASYRYSPRSACWFTDPAANAELFDLTRDLVEHLKVSREAMIKVSASGPYAWDYASRIPAEQSVFRADTRWSARVIVDEQQRVVAVAQAADWGARSYHISYGAQDPVHLPPVPDRCPQD